MKEKRWGNRKKDNNQKNTSGKCKGQKRAIRRKRWEI